MLCDEPGLGKTAQAIEACNILDARYVLVICPASLRTNWLREFKRFGNDQMVLSQSYDIVARDWTMYQGPWDVLIIDEAHYLKSPSAKRTRAIYGDDTYPGLVAMAGHTFALTGTPAPNNAVELYSHMRYLQPESLANPNRGGLPYDYDEFVGRYCIKKATKYGAKIIGSRDHEDLRLRLKGWLLKRSKDEVLKDLPDIAYQPLVFDSESAVKALSEVPDEEMQLIRDALLDGDTTNLADLAPQLPTLRRVTAMAKAALVRDWVKDFLAQTDRKVVIFGHHAEPLEWLRNELRIRDGKLDNWPARITGKTRPGNRPKAVDKFQNDENCRVFIGNIQAAGTGLTLTAASDMIFLEQSWVPAENAQAAMRIHRIGQKNGCLVRYAMLADSIDEAVQRVLARKSSDISNIFD